MTRLARLLTSLAEAVLTHSRPDGHLRAARPGPTLAELVAPYLRREAS